jgi:hypothetical protein
LVFQIAMVPAFQYIYKHDKKIPSERAIREAEQFVFSHFQVNRNPGETDREFRKRFHLETEMRGPAKRSALLKVRNEIEEVN